MNVCVYPPVLNAWLNGWTDLDDILCVCSSDSRDNLDSQLDPVGLTREGAQTKVLRFTMGIFVYK